MYSSLFRSLLPPLSAAPLESRRLVPPGIELVLIGELGVDFVDEEVEEPRTLRVDGGRAERWLPGMVVFIR
jgi:hypothetical protein